MRAVGRHQGIAAFAATYHGQRILPRSYVGIKSKIAKEKEAAPQPATPAPAPLPGPGRKRQRRPAGHAKEGPGNWDLLEDRGPQVGERAADAVRGELALGLEDDGGRKGVVSRDSVGGVGVGAGAWEGGSGVGSRDLGVGHSRDVNLTK